MPRIVYKLLPYAATLLLGFGLVALVRPYYGLLRYNVMHALDFMADTSVSRAAEPVLLRGEDKGIPTYNAPAHITPTFAYEVNTKANLLSIPSIGIDSEVFEGRTESTLLKGIWRIPTTSTPDKGGNTVLTAHRYLQTSGPKTFYLLDKVKSGDKISLQWKGKTYTYTVFETFIAEPTHIEIEQNTKDPILTLYTCTPLWTSKQRIVVRASLD